MNMVECAICDAKGTKTIEILIVYDEEPDKEKQRIGVARFCDMHYALVLKSAMEDKLGVNKHE